MAKTDLTNVLVSVFKISSTGSSVHGSLGRDTVFLFFSQSPLHYFHVQDLRILLGIISFEINVASSQQNGLKCIFFLIVYKKNFKLAKIEVSFIK